MDFLLNSTIFEKKLTPNLIQTLLDNTKNTIFIFCNQYTKRSIRLATVIKVKRRNKILQLA